METSIYEQQLKNRQELLKLYFKDIDCKITPEGQILGFWDETPLQSFRERLFVAYSLLFDDDKENIKKANIIIEECEYRVCHFAPFISTQIVLKHREKLSQKAYVYLFEYIRNSLPEMIDNPEFEFVGVNDNFPCMATFAAIIGGRLVKNDDVVSWGIKNLESFCKMLERRGLQSEHTSPTYTPVQILPMAELVTYTDDERVKELALYAERRLEYGLLAFYHSGMGKMCGPYSRAYTVDSVACIHMVDFWLYSVLGIRTVSALDEMFDQDKMNRVMHGSRWFETVQFVWLAMCDYHVTPKMLDDTFKRKFPYEVKASCEYSSSRDDASDGKTDAIYPASDNEISCYMTTAYSVGISKVPFHNGMQTESFYLLCKKTDKVTHSKDLQSIYLRYLINDEQTFTASSSLLADRGRKIAVANKNIGFVGYRPTRRVVGEKVNSLKLSIIIPQIYENDIQYKITDNEVYLRISKTFVAFYALNNSADIKVEETDEFKMISLYNYCGEAKELTFEDYFNIANGIFYAVDDSSNCTFEEFVCREKVISDKIFKSSHSRQSMMRNVFFEYDGKSLEVEYDIESCGIKYSLIDGKTPKTSYFYDSVYGECDADKIRRIIGGMI